MPKSRLVCSEVLNTSRTQRDMLGGNDFNIVPLLALINCGDVLFNVTNICPSIIGMFDSYAEMVNSVRVAVNAIKEPTGKGCLLAGFAGKAQVRGINL